VSPPRLHAPRFASDIIARLGARGAASRGHAEGLAASERGVAMVEYVTLLCLVTLIGAATVVALGVPLMQLFRYVQMVLAMPIP